VHDFNPGITENGVFWTAAIDPGDVNVNLGNGSASLHVANLDVEDYHNVGNALQDGPSVPASVSFDAIWSGVDERVKIRNPDTGFGGQYVHNTATLTWSASESGFSFTSNPLDSDFAEIGQERDGVFFN
jgi:hypothetical protein